MHNRDASIKETKGSWEYACDFFERMLDDFHSKNLLRRNINKLERERLNLVWENSRNYERALGDMMRRFASIGKPKPEDFAKKCAEVGFTKDTINYLFLSQLIGTFLIKLESIFRTSLLFFLEERQGIKRNMTLGQLLTTIKSISPSIGKELKKAIDTDLRNCLAHGTFWFDGETLFLATNSYLKEVSEISIGKLAFEILKISLVTDALVHSLKQKEKQGYFES